jgi:uncharacterized protein (TIGR02328 family)
MRLWHKDLISCLPKNQLLGQWRELNSIYKLKNKHILINFVYDYPKNHLYNYSIWIIEEMVKRNYKLNLENFNQYFNDKNDRIKLEKQEIFHEKMNIWYLKQCLYNLQEKYDCKGITENEWKIIYEKFGYLLL